MKKVTSLIIAASLVPVLTLGVGSVSAQQGSGAMGQTGTFLPSKPMNAVQGDELMGADVKNRQNDEDIGSVSDLLIDEEGRVTAVVISTGEFLGMGGGDVAISWDKVEQSKSGDDITLYINMSQEELEQAPEYEGDSASGENPSN